MLRVVFPGLAAELLDYQRKLDSHQRMLLWNNRAINSTVMLPDAAIGLHRAYIQLRLHASYCYR